MSSFTGMVPARFLTMTAHLIITITIFWSREDNVKACLPENYTPEQYQTQDTQFIVGLSISLALFAIELIGFFGGLSMFMHTQVMISIAAHASAAVALSYFLFEAWECSTFWWIFGFCSALPAFTEILTLLGVLVFNKGI